MTAGVRVHPPVAVLLSRFPLVTETFILREVIELEHQGWPVILVPLVRERPEVVHAEARPWLDVPGRTLFTPWLSPAIVASHLRALRRRPGVYLSTLARMVAGTLRSPGFLLRSLALFPKAVHLAERLRAAGVAHVHAHFATHPATVAWIVERLAGVPYSLTVHAHDIFVDRALLDPKLRRARFVRSISEYNRDFLAERHPRAAGRLEVIHVGVEPERYRRGETVRERAAGAPVRVLTVAALRPYKGLDVLIEAAARLTSSGVKAVFEVVGDGPLRGELAAAIESRGLAGVVRLVGAVPQDEVARRLAAADLFVLPSVVAPDGQMEGIPVALMEALASELPAVASDLSGIPELVADGVTGLLVSPGDAGAVADAMARLVADPDLGRRLGRAGRERVEERFDLRTTVAALGERIESEIGPYAGADVLTAAVEAALRAPLEAGSPGGARGGRTAGVRRWVETGDSRVAEVMVAGEAAEPPREVVVKVHRDRPGQSAPPAERARRELELLRRLAGSEPEDGRLGVPAPLTAHPVALGEDGEGGAAIVLERARGERLDAMIRRHRLRRRGSAEALEPAFRHAGEWLRWFHRVAGEGRPVVHGDFWPGNLFVAPRRMEGIDFEGAEIADVAGWTGPWDDAAYFLLHAELYFAPFSRGALAPLGGRFRRLERAFLDGFAPTGGSAPLPDARLRTALALLARGGWARRHRALLLGHARRGSAGAGR